MILNIEHASFSYDGITKQFEDISFSLRRGEVLSLLGRNGTGKSTLIKCILNILTLQEGAVEIDGRRVSSMRPDEVAREVGYVPQGHRSVFPFAAIDFVLMKGAPYPTSQFQERRTTRQRGVCADRDLPSPGKTHIGDVRRRGADGDDRPRPRPGTLTAHPR